MRSKAIWRCEECEQELHYKGLCRECTEYDSEGNVLNPVRRVKVNKVVNNSNHNHHRIVNNVDVEEVQVGISPVAAVDEVVAADGFAAVVAALVGGV